MVGSVPSPRISVIVPFHRNLSDLEACLTAVRRSVPDAEMIVAADGATEDYRALIESVRARAVVVPNGPRGPAVARNRASEVAGGDVLFFVDADVVVAPDAIPGMTARLAAHQAVDGIFGAYDDRPRATNFMSQFKNLAHTYVHEVGQRRASTFWAGLGAVRTKAFRAVGGFDERFRRPSVEDIELGYRLTQAGFSVELDPAFRCCHLKRWTLLSCVRTDIEARGIPWTQLLHRRGALANDLNTTLALRLSVIASYALLVSLAAAAVWPEALALTGVSLAALIGLNFQFYRWCATKRGLAFALRVVPVHWLHHLSNGVSFVVGTVLHHANRWGVTLPGSLPTGIWTSTHP
jgi:GT2 family glycosyltransferase